MGDILLKEIGSRVKQQRKEMGYAVDDTNSSAFQGRSDGDPESERRLHLPWRSRNRRGREQRASGEVRLAREGRGVSPDPAEVGQGRSPRLHGEPRDLLGERHWSEWWRSRRRQQDLPQLTHRWRDGRALSAKRKQARPHQSRGTRTGKKVTTALH